MSPVIQKSRILGVDAREALATQLRVAYERGASIRALAGAIGWSYSTTRTLLIEAGTAIRPRSVPLARTGLGLEPESDNRLTAS